MAEQRAIADGGDAINRGPTLNREPRNQVVMSMLMNADEQNTLAITPFGSFTDKPHGNNPDTSNVKKQSSPLDCQPILDLFGKNMPLIHR